MQRVLNYLNAGLLLVLFGAPIPMLVGLVPNYVATSDGGVALWVVTALAYVIASAVFVVSLRMNRRNPPAGFVPPGPRKALWVSLLVLGLYLAFVPMTVQGAAPAVATYVWDAPQVRELVVVDPSVSGSGRGSCEGAVRVEGMFFFSRICGVPEDLRSQMRPGGRIEVTGPGHALGLRVETVRLLD
jgi:hypothetical protein